MISQITPFPKCADSCPRVLELEEEVEGLKAKNRKLKKKLAIREAKIKRMWKKLKRYENPHTPSSRRLGTSRSKEKQGKSDKRSPGRKKGHIGTTRPWPETEETVIVSKERCTKCGSKLGEPIETDTRIIEDIPEPQQAKATEYKVHRYKCSNCEEEIIASHEDLPPEGRLGYNVVVQTTLYKYHGRSVHRKTKDLLKWVHGLELSSATVFDLTRRASDWLRPHYEKVLKRIRNAYILYVDETGMNVNGKKGWIWTFVTDDVILFVMRMSRGKKVLEEVLGKEFDGKMVVDGWRSYPAYTSKIQRCWAHLLREADDLVDKSEEGNRLAESLHKLFGELKDFILHDPPPEERERKKDWAKAAMENLLNDEYENEKVVDLIEKIKNGFEHWFTFLTEPELEPTNNRAERALREHVVQRKIVGTLRNEKGMRIHETITTMLATWELNELDPFKERFHP